MYLFIIIIYMLPVFAEIKLCVVYADHEEVQTEI